MSKKEQPSRSFLVPFHKYEGPGNPLDNGEPVDRADRLAYVHDHAYADAKTEEDVHKADSEFKKGNKDLFFDSLAGKGNINDFYSSAVGYLGIAAKNTAEKIWGKTLYPSVPAMNEPSRKRANEKWQGEFLKPVEGGSTWKALVKEGHDVANTDFRNNGWQNYFRHIYREKNNEFDLYSENGVKKPRTDIDEDTRMSADTIHSDSDSQHSAKSNVLRHNIQYGAQRMKQFKIRNELSGDSESRHREHIDTNSTYPSDDETADHSSSQSIQSSTGHSNLTEGFSEGHYSGVSRNTDSGISNSGTLSTDVEMGLPGTAKGQGGDGDGNANAGMPIYKSVVPFTEFNNKVTTYTKVHRLMSFGIAHNHITRTLTAPAETQRILTTWLASIPWHKPYFYMTPGEYNILGPNAKAKAMRITITHRGNRIAFQTAESSSSLATLNNIQNIGIAYGLNRTGFGVDMIPGGFGTASGETMIPSSVEYNEYNQNYINSWYGFPQNSPNWANEIPDVQVGYKSLIRNYFQMISSGDKATGDPSLAKHIQFLDGKTTINQVVGSFEYHPHMAPLKNESVYQRYGLPNLDSSTTSVNIETNRVTPRTVTFDMNNTSNPTAMFVEHDATQAPLNNSGNSESNSGATSYYLQDIEKGHYMKRGVWGDTGDKAVIQPSVHVGVQAIPALSTINLAVSSTAYTDAQADWEIVAEMDVDEGLGVDFAWSTTGNKAFGDITMVSQKPSKNSCVVGGRFTNESIRS